MDVRVRVPMIADIETAISVYYSYPELGNAQIKELFGQRSPNTYAKLKKAAWELMREEGSFVTNASRVPTATAYRAWGLNIDDLNDRFAKLQRYKIPVREAKA